MPWFLYGSTFFCGKKLETKLEIFSDLLKAVYFNKAEKSKENKNQVFLLPLVIVKSNTTLAELV